MSAEARIIWKGFISFGLVNIPIALRPAVKREELSFRLLRKQDLSPVNYKRVAEADGKEVPWPEIVKGYEYEKGRFVVLKDEDFKRVDVEATETVDILNFVSAAEINPMFFQKPYFMEPLKGAGKAYGLLRAALETSGKIGIAKVVIKTRQHLAAVKPQNGQLILELMLFANELTDAQPTSAKSPPASKEEMAMAKALIEKMTVKWNPDHYSDDYRDALLKLIKQKVKSGGAEAKTSRAKPRHPVNVIDLQAVLRESLAGAKRTKATAPFPKRKKAA